MGYAIRWPFYGGAFNTRAYSSNQLIASDVEAILQTILKDKFGIEESSFKVRTMRKFFFLCSAP